MEASYQLVFAKGKNTTELNSEAKVADMLRKLRKAAELGEFGEFGEFVRRVTQKNK